MVTGDFWVLLAMLLYFIVVVLVGFVYAKKSNASSEAYFLGGRGLGPWLTALSAEASDMSGWLLMGLPGVAYFTGASDAMWTAIGLAIGTYLNWKFVAKRLRKYSEVANNSITVPDFFSNRFHDNKHVLMTIAAIITLVFFSIYTGSCFVTCGKLFSTLFGLDYATMMVLGAIIVFLYTFVGGYLSVCTTDLIQGTLMFFALATVFIGSVAQAGGVENTVAFLQDIPGFLSGTQIATPILDAAGNQVVENGAPLFGAAGEYGLITIVSGLAWGLGYFGMPQVLVRFMSARHSDDIKKSRIIATVWVVVSLASAVCIGLVGRTGLNEETLRSWASEPVDEHVITTPNEEELERAFHDLADTIAGPGATNIHIEDIISTEFAIIGFEPPLIGEAELESSQIIHWYISELADSEEETAELMFTVRHMSGSGGHIEVNDSIQLTDDEGSVVEFPSPFVTVDCGSIIVPECPEPIDVHADPCQDSIFVDAGDIIMTDLGRILQVDFVLHDICPHRRTSVGIIVTELMDDGIEASRGFKVLTIPAHTGSGCRDVHVMCVPFVLPEDPDACGCNNGMCTGRTFRVRIIAHPMDYTWNCCGTIPVGRKV